MGLRQVQGIVLNPLGWIMTGGIPSGIIGCQYSGYDPADVLNNFKSFTVLGYIAVMPCLIWMSAGPAIYDHHNYGKRTVTASTWGMLTLKPYQPAWVSIVMVGKKVTDYDNFKPMHQSMVKIAFKHEHLVTSGDKL